MKMFIAVKDAVQVSQSEPRSSMDSCHETTQPGARGQHTVRYGEEAGPTCLRVAQHEALTGRVMTSLRSDEGGGPALNRLKIRANSDEGEPNPGRGEKKEVPQGTSALSRSWWPEKLSLLASLKTSFSSSQVGDPCPSSPRQIPEEINRRPRNRGHPSHLEFSLARILSRRKFPACVRAGSCFRLPEESRFSSRLSSAFCCPTEAG